MLVTCLEPGIIHLLFAYTTHELLEAYISYRLSCSKHAGSAAGNVQRKDAFAIDICPAMISEQCCKNKSVPVTHILL